jgi:hypothetical protein
MICIVLQHTRVPSDILNPINTALIKSTLKKVQNETNIIEIKKHLMTYKACLRFYIWFHGHDGHDREGNLAEVQEFLRGKDSYVSKNWQSM